MSQVKYFPTSLRKARNLYHQHHTANHFLHNMFFTGVLLLLHSLLIEASALEQRTNGNVCQYGVYGELVPALKPFALAQSYCAAVFPPQCTPQGKLKIRRVSATTVKTSTMSSTQTTTSKILGPSSKTTAKAANPKESAWSKMLQQGRAAVSTLCSCIQDHKVSE